MGVPRERLESIANGTKAHYREWAMPDRKNPAKQRMVRSPLPELKRVQRLIVKRVLTPIALTDSVHGGVRGRSPRTNAVRHLARPCVITLDVKEFFQHVRHEIVFQLFRKELGYGRDVARLLTQLTTFRDELPRGAPTSLAVANLLLRVPLDLPLEAEAAALRVSATRFVDDIALSGTNPRSLINHVAKMLARRGLPMYRKKARFQTKPKLKITPRSRPQEVTGLLVNHPSAPSLSRQRRDRVRAAIDGLRNLSPQERDTVVQSIRGRIRHIEGFNPGAARRLARHLESALTNAAL
jgi:hypothetical protein